MLRCARRTIAGAAIVLMLAASWGAPAAVSALTQHIPNTGTVSGRAYMDHGIRGIVKVFNGSGRLVAHHDVRRSRDYFRFVLHPGRYEVKLVMRPPSMSWPDCPNDKLVRVRAEHTTPVDLLQTCPQNTY